MKISEREEFAEIELERKRVMLEDAIGLDCQFAPKSVVDSLDMSRRVFQVQRGQVVFEIPVLAVRMLWLPCAEILDKNMIDCAESMISKQLQDLIINWSCCSWKPGIKADFTLRDAARSRATIISMVTPHVELILFFGKDEVAAVVVCANRDWMDWWSYDITRTFYAAGTQESMRSALVQLCQEVDQPFLEKIQERDRKLAYLFLP